MHELRDAFSHVTFASPFFGCYVCVTFERTHAIPSRNSHSPFRDFSGHQRPHCHLCLALLRCQRKARCSRRNKNLENTEKLEELLQIFEERKKQPLDYRRNGVITIFVGIGLYMFGFLVIGRILEGVGAMIALFGVGTLIAGYLYPNTGKEITQAVQDFEEH